MLVAHSMMQVALQLLKQAHSAQSLLDHLLQLESFLIKTCTVHAIQEILLQFASLMDITQTQCAETAPNKLVPQLMVDKLSQLVQLLSFQLLLLQRILNPQVVRNAMLSNAIHLEIKSLSPLEQMFKLPALRTQHRLAIQQVLTEAH